MAKSSKLSRTDRIDMAREILKGLRTLVDYRPPSPDLSVEAANEIEARLVEAEQRVILAQSELDNAREQRDLLRGSLHDIIQRMKFAVTLQYGRDSNVVKLLGLKKWSERYGRRRSREEAA